MEKIKKIAIPNHQRIIVISDIHGEVGLLKKLLHKVNYRQDDYLMINGDMCEKGPNSKEVIRYIMDLSSNHPNVYVTEGNCDALIEELLNENPALLKYLARQKHSLVNEWLEELDFIITEQTTVQEIKQLLMKHFSHEIDWLVNLPTAIETEHFIFVHAGLENIKNWQETDRELAISIPSFLEKNHQANKYVVVGHWPVVNYSTEFPSDNPIINEDKKIIAIDGGNMVKPTGQLNALMIEGDTLSYTYVDHFPTRKVRQDFYADSTKFGAINYPYYSIQPLAKNDYFTQCKQLETNRVIFVKNEYIHLLNDGKYQVKTDVSCAQLTVHKDDHVSIIDDNCTGYTLIKKDGMLGWVTKDCL